MTNTIPKFFIPGTANSAEAEQAFENTIRTAAEMGLQPNGRKIFSLYFTHDFEIYTCEVGKPHPFNPQRGANLIQLIVHQGSPALYVVYANAESFLVGHTDTISVTYFADDCGEN